MKFRKKPVVIEAVQWNGTNTGEVRGFMFPVVPIVESGCIAIFTLEGRMIAQEGDWIIKGIKGEFYPCKPDIFEATYEKVANDSQG